MSLETVTRKEKNMQSSKVKEQIPLKILGNKARVLQMEMKLISSTPIRNSEVRNLVNESFQVGSPILRINSTDISQINDNKSKQPVPANANFSVKSNSLESKNVNNPKTTPYPHMILYSSDEDANVITRKTIQKKITRKRRNASFMADTDSEIGSKCAKTNVDNVIDKVANGEENNVQLNTGGTISNEKRIEDNNINKKTKRKYTKKTKTDDILTVQSNEAETEVIVSETIIDGPFFETLNSPRNKLNKETMNTVLRAKNSNTVDKALQLNVPDNEIDRLEKKTKPKLQSKKTTIVDIVSKDKHSQKDNRENLYKRKTKPDNITENIKKNDNNDGKEISQESTNGTRKSSRPRVASQAYWIARSNSQSSDCADPFDLLKNTEDKKQVSKNKRPTAVSRKTKIAKQQKQRREVITNGIKNTDNANGVQNADEHGSNKATQNPNSDLDSCNNDAQTEAHTLQEKETRSIADKQKKKSMPLQSKKPSSFNVRKQPEPDTSPTDTDANTDNIPSDSLVTDFHTDKSSKSTNANTASIIDNYSFKEIALAQRQLAEIDKCKQPEYFGQFPQTYHTHSNNPNLSIGINISNPDFISGVLEIVPGGRKQQEYPKKNNMSFFILEGNAEVSVGNLSKILRIGDSFFVPNNTPYYIINLNKTKRLLILFTKYSAT